MAQTEASPDEPKMVYHPDGRLELRVDEETGRWIATDDPVEVES